MLPLDEKYISSKACKIFNAIVKAIHGSILSSESSISWSVTPSMYFVIMQFLSVAIMLGVAWQLFKNPSILDSLAKIFCHSILFLQAEDGIRDKLVTGVQTCALPILVLSSRLLDTQEVLKSSAAPEKIAN